MTQASNVAPGLAAWFPLLAGAIGGLIALGGVYLGNIFTDRRERQRAKEQVRLKLYDQQRADLERVFAAAEDLRRHHQSVVQAHVEIVSIADLGKMTIDTPTAFSTLKMLVSLYVPELTPLVENIDSQTRLLTRVLIAHLSDRDKVSPRDVDLFLERATKRQTALRAVEAPINALVARLTELAEQGRSDILRIGAAPPAKIVH